MFPTDTQNWINVGKLCCCFLFLVKVFAPSSWFALKNHLKLCNLISMEDYKKLESRTIWPINVHVLPLNTHKFSAWFEVSCLCHICCCLFFYVCCSVDQESLVKVDFIFKIASFCSKTKRLNKIKSNIVVSGSARFPWRTRKSGSEGEAGEVSLCSLGFFYFANIRIHFFIFILHINHIQTEKCTSSIFSISLATVPHGPSVPLSLLFHITYYIHYFQPFIWCWWFCLAPSLCNGL